MSLRISKALHTVTMTLGALVIGATLVPNAIAGCGDVPAQPGTSKPALFKPAAYRAISTFRESGQNGDGAPAGADIVGMWKFSFVSKNSPGIPDDIPIDWGYTQWHSDGTEITNSGTRSPATQNFCMGVWKKVGPSTYKLNHYALSYDTGGTLVGVAVIGEQVLVDKSGNAFSGNFSIDVYDTQGHSVAHVQGLVSATRLTAD
jgi:hypothetical protein